MITIKQLFKNILTNMANMRYEHDDEVLRPEIYTQKTAKPVNPTYREHSGPCRGAASFNTGVPNGSCATCGNHMPRQHSCNEHRIRDTGGPNDDPIVKCEICGTYLPM